ncbi:MAG: hypothetical protein R3330_07985, partial [Saprospiraceae bacterium]|nr:hypothetical protein [Saprospiraceae bacterium]
SVVDVDQSQAELRQRLQALLKERDQLGAKDIHFNVVIYNGFVYITNPGEHFRPRAEQLPVRIEDNSTQVDEAQLAYQLEALGKAFGMTQLHNPDTVLYRDAPLKVEMGLLDAEMLQDITGDVLVVTPQKSDGYEVKLQLKITNTSANPVYVSAVVVSELGGIYTDLVLPEMSIKLKPGEVYEATGDQRPYYALERYKRFYNWPDEHIEYKLIVSSHEPIELSGFAQEELDPPMLCGLRSLTGKGVRKVTEEERKPDWGTVDFTVRLLNPEHNNRSLLDEPELNCDLMRPFASKAFGTD